MLKLILSPVYAAGIFGMVFLHSGTLAKTFWPGILNEGHPEQKEKKFERTPKICHANIKRLGTLI